MVGKSTVSALHEYCAKNKFILPEYEYINSDAGFVCRVTMEACTADGVGRSKRDAKHAAAGNVIKKLRINFPDIDEIPQVPLTEIPTSDMYAALRDYCIQNDHPLPKIEIVQQSGTPDAPEFTALCQVATIKRFGTSEKKTDAKQIAAMEMLNVIMDRTRPERQEVVLFDNVALNLECERRKKFKTYRELTKTKNGEVEGVKLTDRHNYFSKYHDEVKNEAWRVINSTEYTSSQEQAADLFKALKLTPTYTPIKTLNSVEPMVSIELDCDYDAVLVNLESKIHDEAIQYFKNMLK